MTIKSYDAKLSYYADNLLNKKIESAPLVLVKNVLINDVKIKTIYDMKEQYELFTVDTNENHEKMKYDRFVGAFMTIFSPKITNYIYLEMNSPNKYCHQFDKANSYLSLFCNYLYNNKTAITNDDKYILWDIFDMAELYL